MVQRKYAFAKYSQISFWFVLPITALWINVAIDRDISFVQTGIGMLFILFTFGVGGMTAMFIRCSSCKVSYFYDPRGIIKDFGGVDLLKPVKPNCPKCGKDRKHESDLPWFSS